MLHSDISMAPVRFTFAPHAPSPPDDKLYDKGSKHVLVTRF